MGEAALMANIIDAEKPDTILGTVAGADTLLVICRDEEAAELFEEEITLEKGAVVQKNFDTFNSIRLSQMPKVETIIIQGGGKDWGGVGEPTIAVAAPAVLNAIYRATGKRYRTVPLKNSGIKLV